MEFLIVEREVNELPINNCIVTQDIPRAGISKDQIWKLCYGCKLVCIRVDDYACSKCKENMEPDENLDSIKEPIRIDERDKLCQSCIERGYSTPRPATRRWNNGHYICEECYNPLLANLLTGIQSHFTDIITSEDILDNRDKIFNFHHQALVNCTNEELVDILENDKRVLFERRIHAEVVQTLIDKYRAKNRLESGASKSLQEVGKAPKSSSAASKIKQSKEEKTLASLAKTLGMTPEQYKALMSKSNIAEARKKEFGDLLNGKVQSTESPKELEIDKLKGRNLGSEEKVASSPLVIKDKECPFCKKMISGGLLPHYNKCEERNKGK
jgi:hypothetical protein